MKRTIVSVGFLALAVCTTSFAANTVYNWQPTGGTSSWNANASWIPSTAFPNGQGDTANLTQNITSGQTVNLNQAITVGVINIGDTDNTNSCSVQANSGSLSFDNTGNTSTPGDAQINQTSTSHGDTIQTPITLNGTLDISNASANTLTIASAISGTGAILIPSTNTGTILFNQETAGSANTYSGLTTVDAGTLNIKEYTTTTVIPNGLTIGDGTHAATVNVIEYNNAINSAGPLTINKGSLLALNNNAQAFTNVTLQGGKITNVGNFSSWGAFSLATLASDTTAIIANSQAAALDAGNSGSPTFTIASGTTASGIDFDLQGGLRLNGGTAVKTGPGVMRLSGTNTLASGFTVNQGTLLFDTTSSSSPIGVSPGSGNSATLGGTGTITGNVALTGSATANPILSPGDLASPGVSAPGQLTVAGNVTLDSHSTFAVDLNGTTPGTQYDQLIVTGTTRTINVGSGILSVSESSPVANGTMFTIIDNQTTSPITGTFGNPVVLGQIISNGYAFLINYAGGDGNDVVLTAVPEPATLGVMACGALALLGRRRRGA